MPQPFISLSIEQFRAVLDRFPFDRVINAIDLHHTPGLKRREFTGVEALDALYDAHVRLAGLTDLAQHLTIAPDGTIWTGRPWNQEPASAAGHNGNARFGPFMLTVVGNFDHGHDTLDGEQQEVLVHVIAALQEHFELEPERLRFHGQLSSSTCPGSSLDYQALVALVRGARGHGASTADASQGPFSKVFQDDGLTTAERTQVRAVIDALQKEPSRRDVTDAEPPEAGAEIQTVKRTTLASAAARGASISTGDRVALRPHVIDLNEGKLTRGGDFFSLPEDVKRIFAEDLEQAFKDPLSVGMPKRASTEPFRLMLWAHGGLISETAGLAIAKKHLEFWKKNGVYPVYFVWETGFLQTVGQLLRGLLPGSRDARNFFSDRISDPLLERTARALGGEKIWSGMKRNAELASADDGGATLAAEQLQQFCTRHAADKFEIHAAGHSAGSIFHAHFLPVALAKGVPSIASLHLLAPAIRVDTFNAKLLPLIGSKIARTSLFTMVKEQELDDDCASIYRKSLLYLIRFALEKNAPAEILGLEECLRRDPKTAALFGLGTTAQGMAEAIFSPSLSEDGTRATRSTSHGGFDDDAPTMNSVALRVLGLQERSKLRMQYPKGQRLLVGDPWTAPELEELQHWLAPAPNPLPLPAFAPAASPPPQQPQFAAPSTSPITSGPLGSGRRRALCVGIDDYPYNRLTGCVADARLWARTLGELNFECKLLLDRDATYDAIKARLAELVDEARPGDVIVWQYSGHGTQVPDLNGDEASGDSPGQDEAICPVDLDTGRMFVDDEIASLVQRVAAGVNFSMFLDCCHSGTLNRFGVGQPAAGGRVRDERPRFMPLTSELENAYRDFAKSQRGPRTQRSRSRAAAQGSGDTLFSACLSTEVAWESNGHGEFTLRATELLARRGTALSNGEFIDEVVRAFGANPRQTPNLSLSSSRSNRLLAPFGSAPCSPGSGPAASGGTAGRSRAARIDDVTAALDQVMHELRNLNA